MVTDFGVSARNVKRGDVKAEDAEKPPASISACKSGSDDVAKPAGCDTTCHNGGAQQESPPESDLPSDTLLGE